MINEFLSNKEKYFWSISDEINGIIVGGSIRGRNYGQVQFILEEQMAIIRIEDSNGKSAPTRYYHSVEDGYDLIKELDEVIREYLSEEVRRNQQSKSAELMQNVSEYLNKKNNF